MTPSVAQLMWHQMIGWLVNIEFESMLKEIGEA
jgi:hypothetical protein